ncbi:MAG TPA: VIT domain-containing protein, partial [Abditibacteriaceae bacterium]|nr:VIT domain-containing protein [Abditibacteriaceae bacterium]
MTTMHKTKTQLAFHIVSALTAVVVLAITAYSVRAQTGTRDRHVAPPNPILIEPPIRRPWPNPILNQELQLISQAARVDINGGLARTTLTQNFQNTTGRTIEGTYVFPLPEGAAVSGFAMTVNGKRVEAEILDGDKAREIYTGIVQKMKDPGILEFIDRNLIRARIFPIAAGAEQKVELQYTESLRADSNSFRYVVPLRLPVGGAARTSSVDIRIQSASGIRAVYSPTHNVEVKRDGNSARISGEFTSNDPRPLPDRPVPNEVAH